MKSRAGPNGATRRYHGIPFKRPTILPVTPNTITNYAHTTTITLPLLPYHYYPTTTFQLLETSHYPLPTLQDFLRRHRRILLPITPHFGHRLSQAFCADGPVPRTPTRHWLLLHTIIVTHFNCYTLQFLQYPIIVLKPTADLSDGRDGVSLSVCNMGRLPLFLYLPCPIARPIPYLHHGETEDRSRNSLFVESCGPNTFLSGTSRRYDGAALRTSGLVLTSVWLRAIAVSSFHLPKAHGSLSDCCARNDLISPPCWICALIHLLRAHCSPECTHCLAVWICMLTVSVACIRIRTPSQGILPSAQQTATATLAASSSHSQRPSELMVVGF